MSLEPTTPNGAVEYVKLLHDYHAVTEDEINGTKDEIFELLSDEDQVWWFVKKTTPKPGQSSGDQDDGFIPKNFLQVRKSIPLMSLQLMFSAESIPKGCCETTGRRSAEKPTR